MLKSKCLGHGLSLRSNAYVCDCGAAGANGRRKRLIQKLFSRAETNRLELLKNALQEILACPECRSRLDLNPTGESLRCIGCASEFPMVEGIPNFMRRSSGPQEEEKRFRNAAANDQLRRGTQDLLGVAGRHHCLSVMAAHTRSFRKQFSMNKWLLDIGTGYAWPWMDDSEGAPILAIDISMGNLLLAKRLLGESSSVVLLCADAARLPLADGTISGVWSAQTFQHFPEPTFRQAQGELDRVLKEVFLLEFHHLHPAPLYRILCRLRGRQLHLKGRCGPFETNRFSLFEWRARWAGFREGQPEISCAYSELFFHPEMGLRPRPYPVGLERWIVSHVPALAGMIARQGVLRVETALS